MAAEIVVIVENQNADTFAGILAIEIRGGQPADARTYDDKIVVLARLDRITEGIRTLAIAHAVRKGESAVMISAYAGARGRVVIGSLLGNKFIQGSCCEQRFRVDP